MYISFKPLIKGFVSNINCEFIYKTPCSLVPAININIIHHLRVHESVFTLVFYCSKNVFEFIIYFLELIKFFFLELLNWSKQCFNSFTWGLLLSLSSSILHWTLFECLHELVHQCCDRIMSAFSFNQSFLQHFPCVKGTQF